MSNPMERALSRADRIIAADLRGELGAQPSKTPILDGLLISGAARIEDGTIVGIASDGIEVSLGVAHNPAAAEVYLTDFPTPDTW